MRRHPAAPAAEAAVDPLGEEPGLQLVATRPMAAASRGVHRGLWVAIFGWPVLVAALAAGAAGSSPHTPATPTTARAAAAGGDTGGAGGCAQQVLAAWLDAGQDDSAALDRVYAGPTSLTWPAHTRQATSAATLDVRQTRAGYFTVTLAADLQTRTGTDTSWRPAGRHYYQLPVLWSRTAAGTACTAVTLPAEIAAPAAHPDQAQPDYTDTATTGTPLAGTVTDLLTTYLTGTGPLDRFLAAGTHLAAPDSRYRSVQLTGLSIAGRANPRATPATAARLQVLASVTARDADGADWPLTYSLSLVGANQLWQLSALSPGPTLPTSPHPSSSRSPR